MYEFVRGYIYKDNVWERAALAGQTMRAVLAYDDAKIILKVTGIVSEVVIVKDDFSAYVPANILDLSVLAWLDSFTEHVIPESDRPVSLTEAKFLKIRDVWKTGVSVSSGNYFSGYFKTDVLITTPNQGDVRWSASDIEANALGCINGYVHRIKRRADQIYIMDGNKRVSESEDHSIQFLDFFDLGGVTTEELLTEHLTLIPRTDTDIAMERSRVKIELTSNYYGKTPFIVTDGRLNILEDTLRQTGPSTFVVTISHKDALHHALKELTDNRKVEYAYNTNIRDGGITKSTFDPVKYLATTDSFICFIGSTGLTRREEPIRSLPMPRSYRHYRVPFGLVFFENMKLASVHALDYNKKNVHLLTLENERETFMYQTVPWGEQNQLPIGRLNAPMKEYMDLIAVDIYKF